MHSIIQYQKQNIDRTHLVGETSELLLQYLSCKDFHCNSLMSKSFFSELREWRCGLFEEYDWISVAVVIGSGFSSQKDKDV